MTAAASDVATALPSTGTMNLEFAERSPRDYTPPHLAQKILKTKSALEGERKQVTVLFADVTRSMELAEELDPETWHEILDGLFQLLADGMHRFEGTVNQYTGDGVMALFGAPLAHEDHAQRACYAALHLRGEIDRYATEVKRAHSVGLSVRMGLNSGDVVVGRIGDDLRMDYTAQGHTVGLAQRMETLASPGEYYLGPATAELASGYFDLENLGSFSVKNASEPVVVHRLVGIGPAQTRFDVSRARGLTRFVGRAPDMRLLDDALSHARAGHGQVVGVVAPAGTGKSRLCFEFVEQCRAAGLEVLEGRAVAHGRNIPFLPILEIFRAYFGIDDGETDRAVREKVAGRLLLIDEGLRDDLPVLFDFFGVPDPEAPPLKLDADTRQKKLFGLMHRLARDDEAEEPRVYLVEDLHWIDGGSEAFLEQMVDAIDGTRNLILANFRPEYRAEWMSRSWYRQLPLAPLGPQAIRDLLDDLLGADPSTEGLGDAIHERTGGNPFFTEEVVQSLIESGHLEGERGAYKLVTPIESLGVPASVHGVLAARIDRLAEREKRVLQSAGVIGKDFARPILEPVVQLPVRDLDAAIAALKDGEFLYEQTLYPIAEYAFKHPLTQEVALGSLLREKRRQIHRAVAGAIETARADSLDEHSALLAHHWDEAGEALPAEQWHMRAARWTGHTDLEESIRHLGA